MLLVTEKSATSIGLTAPADEWNIAMNTDHSGLVKYQSRTQAEYLIVQNKIKYLADKAGQTKLGIGCR